MTNSTPNSGLGPSERLLLVVLAALLAAGLLWFRGGLNPEAPLERLARQSLDLPVGRSIGARSLNELRALSSALIAREPLPALAGVGAVSNLSQPAGEVAAAEPGTATMAGPRSHG